MSGEGGWLLSAVPEPPPPPGATLYDPRYRDPPPTKYLADVQAGIVGFNPNNFILRAGDWAIWTGQNGYETLRITGNNLAFNNFIVGHDVNNVTLTFTMGHPNGEPNTGAFVLGSGNDLIDTAGFWGTVHAGAGNDTYTGGAYSDVFLGGDGNDLAYGGIGNDLIDGDAGADTLYGGAGADVLNGGLGDDQIYGGTGTNVINDPGGNNYVIGGDDGNHIRMGWGSDTILTGSGLDVIFAGDGADSVEAGEGNNYVDAGGGNDTIFTGNGTDIIFAGGGDDVVYAGNGLNAINGGDGADLIYAGLDSATVDGGGGNDRIFTGNQNDTVFGGDGADVIEAGHGANTIDGGGDNDLIHAGNDSDTIFGGWGNDLIYAYAGNDSLRGGDGSDTIYAAEGNDTLAGDGGDDILYGGTGYSHLDGGNGNDLLIGGDEGNTAFGGAGNDTLQGGAGNDVLDGGSGVDTLYGGAGDDIYTVDRAEDRAIEAAGSGLGGGNDTVYSSNSLYVLDDEIENLTLLRGSVHPTEAMFERYAEDLNAVGNALDNVITGNNGANVLDGRGGADTLIGLLGDDTYIVDSVDDLVIENGFHVFIGFDTDTVRSRIASYTLVANVETLVLEAGAITGIGNGLRNSLYGNDGDNALNGMDGDDSIYGGAGNDTIDGGAGRDFVYYDHDLSLATVTRSGNVVTVVGPDGTDTITNVERILFNGIAAPNALPTAVSATFDLRKVPAGLAFDLSQARLLQGWADADNDSMTALDLSVDHGTALALPDGSFRITVDPGYIGPVTLTYSISDGFGGVVTATMDGTAISSVGNTAYTVTTGTEFIIEAPNDGTDTVTSFITSFGLPANVENLILAGTALYGLGNNLDNVITGNRFDNMMGGGSLGRDLAFGGAGADAYSNFDMPMPFGRPGELVPIVADGNDTFYGGLGNDTVYLLGPQGNVFYGGAGQDLVTYMWYDSLLAHGGPTGGNKFSDVTITTVDNKTTVTGPNGTDIFYDIEAIQFGRIFYSNIPEITNTVLITPTPRGFGNPFWASSDPIPDIHGYRHGPGTYLTQADLLEGIINPSGAPMSVLAMYLGTTLIYPDDNGTFFLRAINFRDGYTFEPSDVRLNIMYDIVDELGGVLTITRQMWFDSYHKGDDLWVYNPMKPYDITEFVGEGNDTVSSAHDYTLGNHVENLILTDSAIRGTGNGLRNHLTGNDRDNILDGGDGIDTMAGGLGNDTYVLKHAREVVIENAGEGHDRVISGALSYRLAANVEELVLAGRAETGFGNSLDNMLMGNAGNNTLVGEGGNDTINGRGGADNMSGGAGDDLYVVDSILDRVIEAQDGGRDRVASAIDWRLAANLENLDLIGSAVNGLGNALDNAIRGNGLANLLAGFDGNDTLNGLEGADTMDGGAGNDLYFVDNLGDVVLDGNAGGIDQVIASVDFTLGDFVENLVLRGAAQSGTGNALNNLIWGNDQDNSLSGLGGTDRLSGGDGADTLSGGLGKDVLIGGAGADHFVFNQLETSANADRIFDFVSGTDRVVLDRNAFAGLSGTDPGALDVDAFLLGTAALTADHRLIYAAASGTLLYDADGVGDEVGVLIAQLGAGTALQGTDIWLI